MNRSKYRLERIDNGICHSCGNPIDRDGFTSCSACAEKIRIRYIQRRKDHICVDCGKAVSGDNCRCEECRAKNKTSRKEEYWALVEMGVCVSCKTYTAAPGRRRCEVCLAKDAERQKIRRERKNAKPSDHKQYMKMRREEAKKNGICITCLRRKASPGRSTCIECATKNRRYLRKLRAEQGCVTYPVALENRICTCCRRERATHGKLCESCYQKSMLKLNKAMNSSRTLEYRERMRRENEAMFILARGTSKRA